MENLMNTGDILDEKNLIPEFIDCIYLSQYQYRACKFNRRQRNLRQRRAGVMGEPSRLLQNINEKYETRDKMA